MQNNPDAQIAATDLLRAQNQRHSHALETFVKRAEIRGLLYASYTGYHLFHHSQDIVSKSLLTTTMCVFLIGVGIGSAQYMHDFSGEEARMAANISQLVKAHRHHLSG